jgi:hypothetical protein
VVSTSSGRKISTMEVSYKLNDTNL